MENGEFLQALQTARTTAEVEAALEAFDAAHGTELGWTAFGGRDANRGVIEVSTDPGRALVERITNGIDAVLEAEHALHRGVPVCRSPKEAATAWLNVPEAGLSEMTTRQRQTIADRTVIRLLPGDGREGRTLEVRDYGIGLAPHEMAGTILSLNESNKMQKHYLAGVYGQGGSSTFTVSKYTLIATRKAGHPAVGFTVVKFLDLPPEQFKSGHYVYLTRGSEVLEFPLNESAFPVGTLVKVVGYDLSSYSSALGPDSVYGLLNRVLFDPVLPVWFDNRVHQYRRVIKGSRNALNGAVDEGDVDRRGPTLAHNVRMFHVTLGEFGRLGIEYWVLEHPTQSNKEPTRAFVNPSKPIILTLYGQNQAELSSVLVRKNAELPHLRGRLISHVDCNYLTPAAKRALFVSNREDARRGLVYELIQQEIVRVLRSDDDLARLNREAHEMGMRERDETAIQQMRSEVARLLRIQGINIVEAVGGAVGVRSEGPDRPTHPRRSRTAPAPIELHEPPTYIRIVSEEGEPITFYAQQRRYVRIETDANSNYHNANNPAASRINLIATSGSVLLRGSTTLQAGRLRAIFEGASDAAVGQTGTVRVELNRPGLPTLSDQRTAQIVPTPPARPAARAVTLPLFDHQPVEGPEDPRWATLGWPDSINTVASSAEMENGTLMIYYSTAFPKYAGHLAAFERRDPALARSFSERYKIWLAVHSLLLYQDQMPGAAGDPQPRTEEDPEIAEVREREERCRTATLAAVFAAREVQLSPAVVESE
jgi:hypothetical protein